MTRDDVLRFANQSDMLMPGVVICEISELEKFAGLVAAHEREGADKDAERYRFLVENSFDVQGVTQFHVWRHSWEPHSQSGEPTEWKSRIRGPGIDAVIDAAISARGGN